MHHFCLGVGRGEEEEGEVVEGEDQQDQEDFICNLWNYTTDTVATIPGPRVESVSPISVSCGQGKLVTGCRMNGAGQGQNVGTGSRLSDE